MRAGGRAAAGVFVATSHRATALPPATPGLTPAARNWSFGATVSRRVGAALPSACPAFRLAPSTAKVPPRASVHPVCPWARTGSGDAAHRLLPSGAACARPRRGLAPPAAGRSRQLVPLVPAFGKRFPPARCRRSSRCPRLDAAPSSCCFSAGGCLASSGRACLVPYSPVAMGALTLRGACVVTRGSARRRLVATRLHPPPL